jgi:DNA-binding MarR family transcriptional regulator
VEGVVSKMRAERQLNTSGGSASAIAPLLRQQVPGHTIWDRPGYLVRRLHQIHVAMFINHVADGEVTPIQYGLLSILVNRPNIDQFTIGEELGLDRANVADILKRLEMRKLVTRVVDPANRRRKLCLATLRGAEFVKRYHQDMQESQKRLLSPLSPTERDVFMDLLARLVEGNNESGRTSLRPGGNALGAARRAREIRAEPRPAQEPALRRAKGRP